MKLDHADKKKFRIIGSRNTQTIDANDANLIYFNKYKHFMCKRLNV